MFEETRREAFLNITSSLDINASLPGQVFKDKCLEFRFFESDQIFSSSFIDALMELMEIEKSISSCLLNISRTKIFKYEEAIAFFFERGLTDVTYDQFLRKGGPSTGWLFSMDHFGCASSSGNWVIYCERNNDVAVIALHGQDAKNMFAVPLRKLKAEKISTLIQLGSAAPLPFDNLVPSWRVALVRDYGPKEY